MQYRSDVIRLRETFQQLDFDVREYARVSDEEMCDQLRELSRTPKRITDDGVPPREIDCLVVVLFTHMRDRYG